jgi:hypothetical protein
MNMVSYSKKDLSSTIIILIDYMYTIKHVNSNMHRGKPETFFQFHPLMVRITEQREKKS